MSRYILLYLCQNTTGKNPIRKNKTRRKIDGFVSGLSPAEAGPEVAEPQQAASVA
ncbi:hypothetical protein ACOJBM_07730 [Rhizobium beringeri]